MMESNHEFLKGKCGIIILHNGYSKQLDDKTMDANCTSTLIKASKNIIIDTLTAWDKDKIVEALISENVKPEEVDYVVCTHNHADHIGNNNLFLNAEHIVGNCVHRGTKFFEKDIENGYELCDGITVISTPGHTTEDVTVMVKRNIDGKSICVAITGDLFEKEEDINDPEIWQSLGLQSLRCKQAEMRSMVANQADYIIPGHGPVFRVTDSARDTLERQLKCL